MFSGCSHEKAAVLVVDDNPLILTVVKGLLSAANYDVVTALNGREALDVLGKQPVDVILCDVMMPEMNGYQFHHAVREKAELSHIPFIFLSALSEPTDVNHGKEIGADDYLPKPFEPENLLSVVRGKIQRSRALRLSSETQYEAYRRRVVHVLSHEFRTPLVAINTGAEILLDAPEKLDAKKVQTLLQAIHRGGQRLERLVTDFMLLQQIEAGVAQRIRDARTDLHHLEVIMREYVERIQDELEGEGFVVKYQNHARDAVVNVYEPQVVEILERLVSNAKKFKGTELVVELVVWAHEEEVVIEVRDRGIGVDVARMKEAMNAFHQLNRDKLEQQGGGLGLAVASRYAAINGGRLEFHNRQGGGTTVQIRLPMAGRKPLPEP